MIKESNDIDACNMAHRSRIRRKKEMVDQKNDAAKRDADVSAIKCAR